ncbi:MAG: hypothetical protein Ct9H300mP1_39050 [Planctomycetaceae bacterium]|nr:MAG: hypothetical protein Ct9H300mP1_39050 [Planctomycetaceae bacterium]
MAIPPVSIGVDEDQLRNYYERILQSISLPGIVQDASGYVGRPMSIELQAGLMNQWGPDRVLFKPKPNPIGPRLTALREAPRRPGFRGQRRNRAVGQLSQGSGWHDPRGADLVEPLVALWNALGGGDWDRATDISEPLTALVMLQESLDSLSPSRSTSWFARESSQRGDPRTGRVRA